MCATTGPALTRGRLRCRLVCMFLCSGIVAVDKSTFGFCAQCIVFVGTTVAQASGSYRSPKTVSYDPRYDPDTALLSRPNLDHRTENHLG